MLFSQLNEYAAKLIIIGPVFEGVAKDLFLEFGQVLGFPKAEVCRPLLLLYILDVLENLIGIAILRKLHTWHVSLKKQVHHEIKQRDHVISSTRRLETELVYAREKYTTTVRFQDLLGKVLLGLLFHVRRCKAHVHQSNIVLVKKVFGRGHVNFFILFVIQKYVFRIQIVVDIAYCVDLLQNIYQLDAERVDLLGFEL